MLNRFFAFNKQICQKIKPHFSHTQYSIFDHYNEVVGTYFDQISATNNVILDVGGGKACHYQNCAFRERAHVIGMDISAEELALNADVDEKIQSDVTKAMPLGDQKVGIVCSECVMEHLNNNPNFIKHSKDVVIPGGYFITLVPGKFALFSLLNQLFGNRLGTKVLKLVGKKSDDNGFCAYYNRTYYSALKKMLQSNGFELVFESCSYSSSYYFDFFLPLYLCSLIWEWILHRCQAKNLCSYLLLVARKKD